MLAAGSYMGRVPGGYAHQTGGSMLGRAVRFGSQRRALRGAGLGTASGDLQWAVQHTGSDAGSSSGFNWDAALGFASVAANLATSIYSTSQQQTSNPSIPAYVPPMDPGQSAWQQNVLMQQQQWQQQMLAAEQLRIARESSKSADGGVSTNTLLLVGGGVVVVLAAVMLLRK